MVAVRVSTVSVRNGSFDSISCIMPKCNHGVLAASNHGHLLFMLQADVSLSGLSD